MRADFKHSQQSENHQLTVVGHCGRAAAVESFDLRKTFSAQLLTKFGVKLPDLRLVPSFPMAILTTWNSVDKAIFILNFQSVHHSGGELRGKQEQRAFH